MSRPAQSPESAVLVSVVLPPAAAPGPAAALGAFRTGAGEPPPLWIFRWGPGSSVALVPLAQYFGAHGTQGLLGEGLAPRDPGYEGDSEGEGSQSEEESQSDGEAFPGGASDEEDGAGGGRAVFVAVGALQERRAEDLAVLCAEHGYDFRRACLSRPGAEPFDAVGVVSARAGLEAFAGWSLTGGP